MRNRPQTAAVLLLGLATSFSGAQGEAPTLLKTRRGFETTLLRTERDKEPLAPPPDALFSLIHYPTPIGEMAAYLSKPPKSGQVYPAIIWITGGFPPGGIGSSAWEPVSSDNDQSAKAYRQQGVIMMYPTLRGSFGNPGVQETFFGEVNDVLASADYLSNIDYVDPQRIYLGGHSTGGTLVLLVSAATSRFRAVFAFGPVADPAGYGPESLTYDPENGRENRLRAPINFLSAIRSPTFLIAGTEEGNLNSLHRLQCSSKNDKLHFYSVKGANHFDVLDPVNQLLAGKIVKSEGSMQLQLDQRELQAAYKDIRIAKREASDLRTLAALRLAGLELSAIRTVRYYLLTPSRRKLVAAAKDAKGQGFSSQQEAAVEGQPFLVLVLSKKLPLRDLGAMFGASKAIAELEDRYGIESDGWDIE